MAETKQVVGLDDEPEVKEVEAKAPPSAADGTEPTSTQDYGNREITLELADGTRITLRARVAAISKLLKVTMEDPKAEVAQLGETVRRAAMVKIIEFMDHHDGVEPAIPDKPLKSNKMVDALKDSWDVTFIDGLFVGNDIQSLYDVLLAANYLDIPSLVAICAAKIACLIKGKPLDQIADVLAVDHHDGQGRKTLPVPPAPTTPPVAPTTETPAPAPTSE